MQRYVGISLIEILISFLLLSTIILGFDVMQLTVLHTAKRGYDNLFAAQEADAQAERDSYANH